MADIFERMERLAERVFLRWRVGWYVATNNTQRSFGRNDLVPEWSAQPIPEAQRVSDPILDVNAPAGIPLAVISKDGVVEAPAYFGRVWDETFDPLTMPSWLQADMQSHPGHTVLGGTLSVRIVAGKAKTTLVPLPDGEIHLETDNPVSSVATEATMVNGTASDKSDLDTEFDTFTSLTAGSPGAPATHAEVEKVFLALRAYIDATLSPAAYSSTVKVSE